jgi:hypothetical protein
MAREKIQFCPQGHDTFIVGRYDGGRCIQCAKDAYKPNPNKGPRKVRKDKGIAKVKICPNGHDKDIVGRDKQGHCIECVKTWRDTYYQGHKDILLPKLKEGSRKRREKIRKIREEKEQKDLQEAFKKGIKFCSKCKLEKSLVDFSLDERRYLGVSTYCKECQKILILDWKHRNKERMNRVAKKRMEQIQAKLAALLRTRLYHAMKGNYKAGSAVRDLGCSIEFLKDYIESLFLPEMSWNNRGKGSDKWHIDHILPLDSFDLTDPIQFKKACHYTNLQPLWEPDNLRKGTKILVTK